LGEKIWEEEEKKGENDEGIERKGKKMRRNTEELRQKGQNRSRKTTCRERKKRTIFFLEGGGFNRVFRPKYRPLVYFMYSRLE
jgi:hypothetical protein